MDISTYIYKSLESRAKGIVVLCQFREVFRHIVTLVLLNFLLQSSFGSRLLFWFLRLLRLLRLLSLLRHGLRMSFESFPSCDLRNSYSRLHRMLRFHYGGLWGVDDGYASEFESQKR